LVQDPSRHRSWNQRSRSAAINTVAIQVRFASVSGEGERQKTRALQAGEVLLEVGVGTHDAVELDRVSVLSVSNPQEPSGAVLEAREEAVLDTRVRAPAAR
jgi:hypothetical protein